jgi:hypothetical protein
MQHFYPSTSIVRNADEAAVKVALPIVYPCLQLCKWRHLYSSEACYLTCVQTRLYTLTASTQYIHHLPSHQSCNRLAVHHRVNLRQIPLRLHLGHLEARMVTLSVDRVRHERRPCHPCHLCRRMSSCSHPSTLRLIYPLLGSALD